MNKNEIFSTDIFPRKKNDIDTLSVSVILIHETGENCIAWYNYSINKWCVVTPHLGVWAIFDTKKENYKWYYPPVTAADAFPRQFTIGDRVECIDDSIIIPGTIVLHIKLNSIYTISGIQKCVCGELEIQLKELLTLNITWNEVDCLKCGYISVQNAFYRASRFRIYNQNPVANQ